MSGHPRYRFGPRPVPGGIEFRLWAPDAAAVSLVIDDQPGRSMEREPGGDFRLTVAGAGPGTAYMFRVNGMEVPDPASRGQRGDAAGWSIVQAEAPEPPRRTLRPWHEAIIAEVHVGTATPEGTFRALIERLDHYRDAGFTAIELMPVAEFAGARNWGYDGVLLYAPERSYGTPRDLAALVEAAHARGLSMMLDVIYNHFGPSGNFLPHYAGAFFRADVATPWGAAIDLENPAVRAFFVENAQYWLHDFDFDGLRFDAVHALATTGVETFLRELAAGCRAIKPECWLVLENHDNVAGWMTSDEALYDAQWNDDWHHVFHVLASGEITGYYAPYASDPLKGAARAMTEGFVFQGEPYPGVDGTPRGTRSNGLAPQAFVSFVQNHDHIGNRPLGDRLAASLPHVRLALLRFVLMLSPSIPLLFMGEEALLPTPFPYFCDFDGELADAVRAGRRGEFAAFFASHDGETFPDPLDEETFRSAGITAEAIADPHAQAELAAFRHLAEVRRENIWPLTASAFRNATHMRADDALLVEWRFAAGTLRMALSPSSCPSLIDGPPDPPLETVGEVIADGNGRLALGPFSAALWVERP